MPLVTYGINHKTAPLAIRERLAISEGQTPIFLQELLKHNAVNEAVLLSTCNRTEIYSYTDNHGCIQQWLHAQHSGIDLTPFCYSYQGHDMVRHLMRVSAGLDSMVVGEPQIFGQIKEAYRIAYEHNAVGQHLQNLFPAAFSACKQIRNETAIGKSPVSLTYAVLQLAQRIFTNLNKCRVLLVGTGEIMELMATHLQQHGIQHLIVANRSRERAQTFADQFNANAIRIGDIPLYLEQIDIVITATASQLPILGKGLIERALKTKKRRPIFMADLAVPRDIEPEVAELEDVYLYNIDDLQGIIQQNLQHRNAAAEQAEAMIEIQVAHYMQQLRIVDASDMIRQYREQIEDLRDQELAKAYALLVQGKQPETVLTTFAHNLINKIMHKPTIKIRQAAYNEEIESLLHTKDLLDL